MKNSDQNISEKINRKIIISPIKHMLFLKIDYIIFFSYFYHFLNKQKKRDHKNTMSLSKKNLIKNDLQGAVKGLKWELEGKDIYAFAAYVNQLFKE